MKKVLYGFILSLATLFFFAQNLSAISYDHSLALKKMEFHWKVDGDSLHVKIKGETKGWIAIGFNPEEKMRGANIIIGYVKRGKVKIADDYGTGVNKHKRDKKLGGKQNIENKSGSEEGGVTELIFTIPLNSGDPKDTVINPKGVTKVIMAYGAADTFRIGHKDRFTLEVNLSTGEYKEIN